MTGRKKARRHALWRARTRLGLKLTMEELRDIEAQILLVSSDKLYSWAKGLSIRVRVVYRGKEFTAVYDLERGCIATVFE